MLGSLRGGGLADPLARPCIDAFRLTMRKPCAETSGESSDRPDASRTSPPATDVTARHCVLGEVSVATITARPKPRTMVIEELAEKSMVHVAVNKLMRIVE